MEQTFVNNVLPKLGLGAIKSMHNAPLWFSYDREGDAVHVIFEEAKKSDKAALEKMILLLPREVKRLSI